jgi:predicted nucleotidyltransferase
MMYPVFMKRPSQIVELLKHLDAALEQDEMLVVCGGMALMLAFGGKRQTFDVDIIAPVPMSAHLKKKVREVGEEFGADPLWLNDGAKGFASYLPAGWETRLVRIDLGFRRLNLFSIGRPDLIMLKLKAGRAKDIADVKDMGMTQEDAEIVLSNLERVAVFDNKAALTIKLLLEEWGLV